MLRVIRIGAPALLLPLALATAACLDDGAPGLSGAEAHGPTTSTAADQPTLLAQATVPIKIGPLVTSFKSSGTFCPSGSVAVSETAGILGLMFSKSVTGTAAQTCTLEIGVKPPAGVSIEPDFQYVMSVSSGRPLARLADLRVKYSVVGDGSPRNATRPISFPAENRPDLFYRDTPGVATRCDQATSVLKVDITIAPNDGTAAIEFPSLAISLSNGNATYRSCGTGRVIEAPKIQEGSPCGPNLNGTCDSGLSCEPNVFNSGRACVRTTGPMPVNRACGGRLGVTCESGSSCRYGDKQALARQQTSVCSVGETGDVCNPSVRGESCQAGLSCFDYTCYVPGAMGAPCGSSYPACNAGLQCSTGSPGVCYQSSGGSLGEACQTNADCASVYRCDANTNKCAASGRNGGPCTTNADCTSNFCSGSGRCASGP
jgi:hypothetical protein